MRYLAILLAAACLTPSLSAQTAFLVADLNQDQVAGKVSPSATFAVVGDRLVFSGSGGSAARSLWATDGTEASLVQITDGMTPLSSAEMGGVLYFLSGSELGPHGLWRTDGTRAGTWLLHWFDRPFPIDSGSVIMTAGDQVFFFGYDLEHGQELWKTDGTVPGTVLVADLNPGRSHSFVFQMVPFHNEIYFSAETARGFDIWRSDGTTTFLVADFGFVGSVAPHPLLGATSDFVFYIVADTELWRTDGTGSGTIRLKTFVKDLTAPFFEEGPSDFLDLNGTALFVANDGTTGRELWRSDGTEAGTVLVKDVHAGDAGTAARISYLTASGRRAYFSADDGVHGQELWTTDGTAAGTQLVRDIVPGTDSSNPVDLAAGLGLVFFSVYDGVAHGEEPWRSDGTEEGTFLLADIDPGVDSSLPGSFTELGGRVYFDASQVLWITDGTAAGTLRFDNSNRNDGSYPVAMTDVDGTVYFAPTPDPSQPSWKTLWTSDGTAAGTRLLQTFCSLWAPSLQAFHGDLYFIATDCAGSQLVWNSHGLLEDIPDGFVTELVTARETLYFWDRGALWRSDGTSAGTVPLRDGLDLFAGAGPLVVALPNGFDYFVTQGESGPDQIWRTDGTPQGTEPLASPGQMTSRLAVLGHRLLFAVVEGQSPSIWTSDGTGSGTVVVTSLSAPLTAPLELVVSGGQAYWTDSVAHELWRTDGTAAGTFRVAAIEATSLTDVGGVLFFVGDDRVHGKELWRSDGTPGGTRMVRDIWPGPLGSSPTSLQNIDGVLVFAAHDGVNGGEVWRSDGTKPGTYIVADINPGIGSSDPSDFARSGDLVFFRADDGATGMELWAIPASAITELTGPRRPPARVVSPRH